MDEYYILLELERGASLEEVKSARRELLQVWHPDRFKHKPDLAQKAEERSKRINDAADRLLEYIRSGQQDRTQSSSSQTKAQPTGSGYGEGARTGASTPQSSASGPPPSNVRLRVVIAALLVLALLGLGSIVRSVIKNRPQSHAGSPVSRTLLYPGARVILDLSDSGGSVLQLTTSDPLEKVQAWYAATLKPTKILQVTSGTVILRKDNVAATLVAQNNTTNIVIKQSVP